MTDVTQLMTLSTAFQEQLAAVLWVSSHSNDRQVFRDQFGTVRVQIDGKHFCCSIPNGLLVMTKQSLTTCRIKISRRQRLHFQSFEQFITPYLTPE